MGNEYIPDENSLASQAACPKRYEIKRLIGRGGMGMVFHAFDKEMNRDVAIKVLWTDGRCDDNSRERVMREAKAMSMLSHPNLVQIYSSGLNDNGYPYHVMEFAEGEPLAAEISRGPLTASRFFEVFFQVVAGLEHAHAMKIAHRDLKPSNIISCRGDGQVGLCKIIDFGIARFELSSEQAAHTITRTDCLLGSPLYMSPEQCRGERGSYRSDIYMLGCIMYECISGQTPFQGNTSMEIMYKHMAEPAPDLAKKDSSPQSRRLAGLISGCLQKDPAARPESMSAIATELKEISATGSNRLDLFRRTARTPRSTKLTAGAICLLALMVGGGLWLLRQPHKNETADSVLKTAQQKVYEKICSSRLKLSEMANADPLERVKLLLNLGRWQLKSASLSDIAEAESTFTQAVALCEKSAALADRLVACLVLRGKARWKQDEMAGANSDFEQALKVIQTIKEPEQHEIMYDFLNDRIAMRIHQRRYSDVMSDIEAASKNWNTYHRGEGLALIDAANPHLDRQGDERRQLVRNCPEELQKMKPGSESEAIQMIRISTFYGKVFATKAYMHPPSAAKNALKYSEDLLNSCVKEGPIKLELQRNIAELKVMIANK